jgi:hypothetical protein
MKRLAAASLALLSLVLAAAPVRALGAEKPWFGGVYSGFSGYSEATGLPAAEYMAFGLFAEPLAIAFLNPALHCGLMFPLSPATSGGLHLQVALDLTIADIPAAFLKRRFYLTSRWSPGVGAECLVPIDFADAHFALLVSPLRVRAGDGTFTIASVELFLDREARFQGWGITLFKASLFLF